MHVYLYILTGTQNDLIMNKKKEEKHKKYARENKEYQIKIENVENTCSIVCSFYDGANEEQTKNEKIHIISYSLLQCSQLKLISFRIVSKGECN